MPTSQVPDFTIRTLGPALVASPLRLARAGGPRGQADFTADDERVLYHDDWAVLRGHSTAESGPPPSMELAGPREKLFFRPSEVRAALVTAGGLCPGINEVTRSVTMTLLHHYGVRDILGIRYGLRGFVAEDTPPVKLSHDVVHNIHRQGGSFLGSSRGSPPVEQIVRYLDREAISILLMVGGDGTQKAALAISRALREANMPVAVVGIPKTIDNDILYVDQTFGFSTAVEQARTSIDAAHAEAKGAYNGVGLVRLMGRDSGFIAAQAALASAEANFVLVPEVPFDMDGPNGFLAHLHRRVARMRHSLVVVAEGAGQEFLEDERMKQGRDASGNQMLGDIGRYLRGRIRDYFAQHKVEATVRYIDPGYTIRSAPADASDAVYCQELGQNAVHAAMAGKTEMLVGRVHGRQVHVPILPVTSGRKRLDPEHPLWRAVLQATGQPPSMKNVPA
jgi:6-phosphofructokinase 1